MSPSKKTLMVMIGIAVILAIGWAYIFGRLVSMKSAYVEQVKLLMEERSKEVGYMAIQNTLRDSEELRAKLADYFINKDSVVSFVEELELVGRQSGIVLDLTSVQPVKQESLTFYFQVSGSFNDIYSFVRLIELLPYKITVDSVDVKMSDGFIDEGKGQTAFPVWNGSVTVSLKSYLLDQ